MMMFTIYGDKERQTCSIGAAITRDHQCCQQRPPRQSMHWNKCLIGTKYVMYLQLELCIVIGVYL